MKSILIFTIALLFTAATATDPIRCDSESDCPAELPVVRILPSILSSLASGLLKIYSEYTSIHLMLTLMAISAVASTRRLSIVWKREPFVEF
jgi:hypothetical protein